MNKLFDTTRLKDSDSHWDALSARVAANATSRDRRSDGLVAFAGSGRAWATATLFIALAAVAMLFLRSGPTSGAAHALGEAIEPTDQLGRAISASPAPPSIGALLLGAQSAREPR